MTTESFNDPIDPMHAESVTLQGQIRSLFQELRDDVAVWEPRPCPDWFQARAR